MFVKRVESGTIYTDPIKCSLTTSIFGTIIPGQANRNEWCSRTKRTLGDTDGDGSITPVDLGYYSNAVNGRNIPITVNPDINGDGLISPEDREIIIRELLSQLP